MAIQLLKQCSLHPPVVTVAEAEVDVVLCLILMTYWVSALRNPSHYIFVDDENTPSEMAVSNSTKDNCDRETSREDEEGELKASDSFFIVLLTWFDNPGVIQQGHIGKGRLEKRIHTAPKV